MTADAGTAVSERRENGRGIAVQQFARRLLSPRLVWLLPVGAAALAVWVVSPRFALTKPSLLDDWYAINYSGEAVHGLLHGHYDTSAVEFSGRFRPAYSLWNYLQWHVGSSDSSLTVAEAWGMVRLFLFLLAVGAITFALVRNAVSRGWAVALGTAAATALALTPDTAVDLARFGAAEPLSVAGLGGGLLLITWGLGRILEATDRTAKRLGACAIASGYLLYVFAVYLKESSAGILLLLPFLYLWLRQRAFVETRGRRLWRERMVMSVGTLLVLPLAHESVELFRAMHARNAYLGTEGLLHGATTAGLGLLMTMLGIVIFGAPVWFVAFGVGSRVALSKARIGDQRALLCCGILATGTVLALIPHFAAPFGGSRYFLPWLAAVAIVAASLLVYAQPRVRVVVLTIALAVLLFLRPHGYVQAWASDEQRGSAAIDIAASLIRGHCAVYLSGFTHERRLALPRLLQFADASRGSVCQPGSHMAYTLHWGVSQAGRGAPAGCGAKWRPVAVTHGLVLLRCRNFVPRSNIPDQDVNGEVPRLRLVRLVIPQRAVNASQLLTVGAQ